MEENKFNYVTGVAVVLLLVIVVYLGGKVSDLQVAVADLSGQVDALSSLSVAPTDGSSDMGYQSDGSQDQSASIYDSFNYDYQPVDNTVGQ